MRLSVSKPRLKKGNYPPHTPEYLAISQYHDTADTPDGAGRYVRVLSVEDLRRRAYAHIRFIFSDPRHQPFAQLPLPCPLFSNHKQPSRQASAAPREIPPELEEELFSRNRFFFEEGFEAIRGALVIVVGLGGVGSHAAHMLVSVYPSLFGSVIFCSADC